MKKAKTQAKKVPRAAARPAKALRKSKVISKTAKKTQPEKSQRAKGKSKIKPKVAFYWCSSCGGCEEAIVDLKEKVLEVVAAVDIIFWPCAMDFKVSDVEAMADKSIAVSFINGAIRTSEQEHMAKLLRKKSGLVVAFGACAYQGGIPALANLKNKPDILDRIYRTAESNVNSEGTLPQEKSPVPGATLTLPNFYQTVHKLSDVIEVDYYLPGCPPSTNLILGAVNAILSGKLPERGAVLAPNHSLCHDCARNQTKPDRLDIGELKRIHQVAASPDTCFLAQGILCMGPATRTGCGEACIKGNMPCTGCFGPLAQLDQGAKMVSALGGIYPAESEADVQKWVENMVDPAGTFYRYGLAASILGSKREDTK